MPFSEKVQRPDVIWLTVCDMVDDGMYALERIYDEDVAYTRTSTIRDTVDEAIGFIGWETGPESHNPQRHPRFEEWREWLVGLPGEDFKSFEEWLSDDLLASLKRLTEGE